jgi:hypothetical protein
MFTAADIEDMRGAAEDDMLVAVVYRLKPVGVGAGFRTKGSQKYPDDYAVQVTTRGRFEEKQATGSEIQTGGQTRSVGDFKVELKWDAGASEKDVSVIDSRAFNHIADKTGQHKITQEFDANEIR